MGGVAHILVLISALVQGSRDWDIYANALQPSNASHVSTQGVTLSTGPPFPVLLCPSLELGDSISVKNLKFAVQNQAGTGGILSAYGPGSDGYFYQLKELPFQTMFTIAVTEKTSWKKTISQIVTFANIDGLIELKGGPVISMAASASASGLVNVILQGTLTFCITEHLTLCPGLSQLGSISFESPVYTALGNIEVSFNASAYLQLNVVVADIFHAFIMGGIKFTSWFKASCSTAGTTSLSGSPCYWDSNDLSCPACTDDYCQCAEDQPRMCTKCGESTLCTLEGEISSICDISAACDLDVNAKAGVSVTLPNPVKMVIGYVDYVLDEVEKMTAAACDANKVLYDGVANIENYLDNIEKATPKLSWKKTWTIFNYDINLGCSDIDSS